MADLDLQEIHDTLVSIAYEAGRMILNANPTDIDQGTKLNCESLKTTPRCPSVDRYTRLLRRNDCTGSFPSSVLD